MLVAAANHLVSVIDASGGEVEGQEGNEDKVAEMLLNCHEGMRIFAFHFWHSSGWSLRNEALRIAVLRRVVDTGSHWIVACDANMEPTNSLGAIESRSPELMLKLCREEALRTVLRAQEE